MRASLARERDLSFKLLSDARAKKPGYDSQATRQNSLILLPRCVPQSSHTTGRLVLLKRWLWDLTLPLSLVLGRENTALGIAVTFGGKPPQDLPHYLATE